MFNSLYTNLITNFSFGYRVIFGEYSDTRVSPATIYQLKTKRYC